MLNSCLRTFLISTIVLAADRKAFLPQHFEITNADKEIFVEVPAAMAQGRLLEGISGTYAQLITTRTQAEPLFFQLVEQDCGTRWSRTGQWRTTREPARYLFVFNARSQAGSRRVRQRWIIASFDNKGGHIEHLIRFDTETVRLGDSSVKFSVLKHKPLQHATNTASNSGPGQRPITPVVQSDLRSVEGLSQALQDAETKLIAQSGTLASISAHRDRLQQKVDEIQVQLSENSGSANSQIEHSQNQIAVDHKAKSSMEDEMAQWKDVMRDQLKEIGKLRRERDGLRNAQALAEQHQKSLQSRMDSKESVIGQLTAEIKVLKQSFTQVLQDRDEYQKAWNDQMIAVDDRDRQIRNLNDLINQQQNYQPEQSEDIVNIRLERNEAKSELEVSRQEIAELKSRLSEMQLGKADVSDESSNDNEPPNSASNNIRSFGSEGKAEQWKSPIIWCCISAVVVTLVVLLIFCIYHRRRLRKEHEETMRLHRVISINKSNRNRDVIVDMFPNKRKMVNEGKKDQEMIVTNGKRGERESFNDLMQNMDEVQEVLMDDIMDEMVTEGGEQNQMDERHPLVDGSGEGQVVTGTPTK